VPRVARAARGAAADLADVPDERLDDALGAIADELGRQAKPVLAANEADMAAARADGVAGALLDRLRLDEARLEAIAGQLRALAAFPAEPSRRTVRELPGGLLLEERRRPVGVIGANFEARPNVVVDIASQFVKSRNAGVLRTGSAAIRSAIALADEVIAPALDAAGLDPAMIQLVRVPGQSSARALVSQPGLIPLVILRGSGDSTRSLAAEAARHGVRTMAHADGGAVLFVDAAADLDMAERLIEASLDRLGVDRVELYLAHEYDPDVPLAESFGAFGAAQADGLIGAYGVSNFDAAALAAALAAGTPQAVQNSYSLLARQDERDVLPLCAARGVAYLAFGPLAGGWLTGKYRRGAPYPAGSRMTQRPEPYQAFVTGLTFDALDRLQAIAARRGTSLAGLALGWLLAGDRVAQVVIGPGRPEHLAPVAEALRHPVTEAERTEIEAAVAGLAEGTAS